MSDKTAKLARLSRVGTVFTPGAPIDRLALFAGRFEQIMDVMNAINQRGQHAALFGERGVGKTSLANILAELYENPDLPHITVVRANATTDDTFGTLWQRIFDELGRGELAPNLFTTPPGPEDIRLSFKDEGTMTIVVIDELDRFDDEVGLSLLADTVKTLSDHSSPVTLVFVGVADSVDQLVGDHKSVERALIQVHMPRMSPEELREIIEKGMDALGMTIEGDARDRIVRLSEGLPYYAHALAFHATQRAVADDRDEVSAGDVQAAVGLSIKKAQASVQADYQRATRSPRPDHLFKHVLLACALAEKDDLGFFSSSAVREPMSEIMSKPYDIPAFARHLVEFTAAGRGSVLQRVGEPRRYFYRFTDAVLQPYVILQGISDGLITEEQIRKIEGTRQN